MKIVSWNIRNIGNTKLSKGFVQKFTGFGLGNNVGDYIAGFVMGANCWNAVPNISTNPADIFVVIELKSGGKKKGNPISGTCLPTLNNLLNKMNTLVTARYPGNPNPPYHYSYATPLLIGRHETVGIIYNDIALTCNGTDVLRNTLNNNWVLPRSVFRAQFTVNNTGNTFSIGGLHAPPPGGGQLMFYRAPIDYSNLLYTTLAAATPNTFFMGDFNLDPTSRYRNGAGQAVAPFQNLVNFGTFLPNNTKSSVRVAFNGNFLPPDSYLSAAYDNIIFNAPLQQANTRQAVADLIGQSRNMNVPGTPNLYATNIRMLVNAYNKVSDHLPVVIEF